MRSAPKRPKIEDVGLKKWLNSTKEDHNGQGYERFIEMLDSPLHYSKPQIATEFGVSKETIYQWIRINEKELEVKK